MAADSIQQHGHSYLIELAAAGRVTRPQTVMAVRGGGAAAAAHSGTAPGGATGPRAAVRPSGG